MMNAAQSSQRNMALTLISIINGFICANARTHARSHDARVQSISLRCGAESTAALARALDGGVGSGGGGGSGGGFLARWRVAGGRATMVFGVRSFWHDASGVERGGRFAPPRSR